MAKRIVVCSDGTGNTAIKGRGTNVFKMFEAIDLNGHRLDPALTPQVAIYDDGVGTEDFKPLKLIGGAFGWGLSRNVKQLYKELARVYDPGDEIYMFGFSRGAFTVYLHVRSGGSREGESQDVGESGACRRSGVRGLSEMLPAVVVARFRRGQ
jgi:uncharacterized protein (DUF2235 family)